MWQRLLNLLSVEQPVRQLRTSLHSSSIVSTSDNDGDVAAAFAVAAFHGLVRDIVFLLKSKRYREVLKHHTISFTVETPHGPVAASIQCVRIDGKSTLTVQSSCPGFEGVPVNAFEFKTLKPFRDLTNKDIVQAASRTPLGLLDDWRFFSHIVQIVACHVAVYDSDLMFESAFSKCLEALIAHYDVDVSQPPEGLDASDASNTLAWLLLSIARSWWRANPN